MDELSHEERMTIGQYRREDKVERKLFFHSQNGNINPKTGKLSKIAKNHFSGQRRSRRHC